VATVGTGKLARRGADRRSSAGTPSDVGAALRDARERLGVSLGEVRDRTGIPWQHLEALEAMDLARLPDQRTVVTAARRYSEVVGLDPSEVCGTALRVWQDVHWTQARQIGPTPSATGTSPPPDQTAVTPVTPSRTPPASSRSRRRQSSGSGNGTGKSKRSGSTKVASGAATANTDAGGAADAFLGTSESGTRSSQKSFTQTAEVPGIARGAGLSLHFADTGEVPVTRRFGGGARPVPRWLLISDAVVAVLLVIAGAGMVVHHYKPQWLKDIHVTRESVGVPTAAAPSTHGSASPGTGSSSRAGGSSRPLVVTQPSDSTDSASVTVRARSYQVVVLAQDSCWVDATVPNNSTPVYEDVMQAGQTQVLTPSGGQISIQLGASAVVVGVQIGGKTVTGWLFAPSSAPFTLNFASAPGS